MWRVKGQRSKNDSLRPVGRMGSTTPCRFLSWHSPRALIVWTFKSRSAVNTRRDGPRSLARSLTRPNGPSAIILSVCLFFLATTSSHLLEFTPRASSSASPTVLLLLGRPVVLQRHKQACRLLFFPPLLLFVLLSTTSQTHLTTFASFPGWRWTVFA